MIKKLFCPHCLNEQNIECEIAYDQYSGLLVGDPYCVKCKEKILELKDEFISKYQVNDDLTIKDANEFYKKEEFFSDHPYSYQETGSDSLIFLLIGIVYLPLLIISIFSKSVIAASCITVLALVITLAIAYISIESKLYLKFYNYILHNGKKYSGKVVHMYKFEHRSGKGLDTTYTYHYFLEIEYFNLRKNKTVNFFTPEIEHPPANIKNINCDVFAIDEFPNKIKKQFPFKRLKIIPHEYAINFKSSV